MHNAASRFQHKQHDKQHAGSCCSRIFSSQESSRSTIQSLVHLHGPCWPQLATTEAMRMLLRRLKRQDGERSYQLYCYCVLKPCTHSTTTRTISCIDYQDCTRRQHATRPGDSADSLHAPVWGPTGSRKVCPRRPHQLDRMPTSTRG